MQRIAAFVGLMVLALADAGTASAQVFYPTPRFYRPRYYAPGLSPSQIVQILQYAGLTPLSAPVRRGPNYVVMAATRSGQVRVIVDAYEGDILSVRPIAALRQYGEPAPDGPGVAVAPPGADGAGPGDAVRGPLLRRSGPNQRLTNAPPSGSAGAVGPRERTPIPRPRPSMAANAAAATTEPTPAQPPAAPPPAATPPAATAAPAAVPPASAQARPATRMVPVAPLD